MTRRELVRAVAARRGIPVKTAEEAVNLVFDAMRQALCEGRRVEIRGFGTFHSRRYAGFDGRDPRTGEPVRVESKVLPAFRVGKVLRARLNGQAPPPSNDPSAEEERCGG